MFQISRGGGGVLNKVLYTEAPPGGSTPYPLRTVPSNTDVFCEGYDYGGKADLSKSHWKPKRKMWVTTHYSEII